MRVAVLADIHGNLPALEAVLAEPDVATADRIVLLGDIALGPLPAESLDLLARWGSARSGCTATASARSSRRTTGSRCPVRTRDGARATAALLEQRHRDLLDGLPLTVSLDVDGLGRDAVLPCDAATRRRDGAGRQPGRRVATGAGRACRKGWSSSVTRTCRSTGWSTGGGWSTRAAWACRTAPRARAGHCSARRFSCAARRTTSRRPPRGSGPGAIRMRRRGRQEYVLAPPSDVEALEVFSKLVDPL